MAREANDADVHAMRETIMTSKRPPQTTRRAAIACALLLVLVASVISLRREPPQTPVPIVRKAPIQRPATHQLEMKTPGGTRLIWVFNDSRPM